MILINPKSNNPYEEFKAIETPIWCAMLAQDGDVIWDLEVQPLFALPPQTYHSRVALAPIKGDFLIVVMGNNPSVSSTPKMPEALEIMRELPQAKITGLHPMAMGEATYQIPPPYELIKIPRAKWELLDMSKYRAHNWHCLHDLDSRDKYAALYTSFGCPFDCNFCNIHTIYKGRNVYYRPPEDVIAEIDYLVENYGIKNLKICDELFTLNRNHVTAICSGIKQHHLNIWAYARVGLVTPLLLETMKEAGINWLAYGFESGNQRIKEKANKYYREEKAFDARLMAERAGVHIIGNFMFGLPGDTQETMHDTYLLAERLNCEWVNFYCAMAYPGSKIYKGGNTNWESYNQYGDMAVEKRVWHFRDMAFNKYFSSPRYLTMIKKKFGDKAVEHIESMLEVR